MSRYNRYPAYKDSGVEWIGEVPEHWSVTPIKLIAQIVNGATPESGTASYWDGNIAWFTPADLDNNYATTLFEPRRRITYKGLASCAARLTPLGSVVLSTRAPVGSVGVTAVESATNQGCRTLVPRSSVPPKLIAETLIAARAEMVLRSNGTTFQELSTDSLASLRVPLPPPAEQSAIAAAIDRETARLDALITKKTRFIELLKEKRSALITHAVTKGLDPTVKMKDSGVEWIGEVPEHWGVPPVKICYEVRLGKMLQPNAVTQADILVPYHRAQTVQWERIDDLAVDQMWASRADIERFSVDIGDLLICEGGDVCRAAIVRALVGQNLIFQNSLHRVRPKGRHGVEWVLRLMQHLRSSGWIDVLCNKNTIVHFTSEKLGALACPLPPPSEQSAIAAFLDRETARIDALIAKVQRSTDLLKERRAAFITAAVTGQIDLRGEMA